VQWASFSHLRDGHCLETHTPSLSRETGDPSPREATAISHALRRNRTASSPRDDSALGSRAAAAEGARRQQIWVHAGVFRAKCISACHISRLPASLLSPNLPHPSPPRTLLVSDLGAPEMSTPVAARKKKGSTPSALDAAAAAAPARTLGRGGFSAATARSLGRGGGSAPTACSLERGGSSTVAVTRPTTGGVGMGVVTAPSSMDGSSGGGFPSSSSSMDGFSFPPSPSPAWFDAAGDDPSSHRSW
jgi:hypothetical protein